MEEKGNKKRMRHTGNKQQVAGVNPILAVVMLFVNRL